MSLLIHRYNLRMIHQKVETVKPTSQKKLHPLLRRRKPLKQYFSEEQLRKREEVARKFFKEEKEKQFIDGYFLRNSE